MICLFVSAVALSVVLTILTTPNDPDWTGFR